MHSSVQYLWVAVSLVIYKCASDILKRLQVNFTHYQYNVWKSSDTLGYLKLIWSLVEGCFIGKLTTFLYSYIR